MGIFLAPGKEIFFSGRLALFRTFLRTLLAILILIFIVSSVQAAPLQQGKNDIYLPVAFIDWPEKWLGPEGGTIVALAYDPTNPDIVYAGSWGAGVYKSFDGGRSWATINSGLDNLLIQSLAVNPGNPETLYAGTYKGKLYKSTNGGESWTLSSNGIQDEAIVYSIVVDPWDIDNIYISTRGISNNGNPPWKGVVYRSINNGATWIPSLKDVGGASAQDWVYSLSIHTNQPRIICAATHEHGPYCSQDEGLTWSKKTTGITDLSGRAILIDSAKTDPFTMYFGVWHGAGVFKSVDGGKTWALANKNLNGAKVYALAFNQKQPETLFLGTFSLGIFKTQNSAKEWSSSGLPSKGIFTLVDAANAPGTLLAGVMSDGVYRTTDGGQNWTPSNANLFSTSISSIVQIAGQPSTIIASTMGNGVFLTNNRGKTWQSLNANLPDAYVHKILISPSSPDTLFALTDTAGLMTMNLNAQTGWTPVSTGIPDAVFADNPFGESPLPPRYPDGFDIPPSDLHAVPLTDMIFASESSQTAYLTSAGAGIFRSLDGGVSWNSAGLSGKSLQSLVISPLSSLKVAVVVSSSSQIQTTSDGGTSWSTMSLPVTTINTLAYTPSTETGLLAGTDKGVFRQKTDQTWEWIGLSGQNILTISFNPGNPALILAGCEHGFYYSNDGGLSWLNGPVELAPYPVSAISSSPVSQNQILLGTRAHGIFMVNDLIID